MSPFTYTACRSLKRIRSGCAGILLAILFCVHIQAQALPTTGTLDSGCMIAGQPSVQWYKVTEASPVLSVAVAASTSFTAAIVEDIGFGHGQPPASAFSAAATGSCFNCWLGIRFFPTAVGPQTTAITLSPSPIGSAYTLSLTGSGTPATGLLLSPSLQDFGSISVNSTSAPALFTLTNLTGAAVSLSRPALSGDFAISSLPTGGADCTGTLAYTASCYLQIAFSPLTAGLRSGTLTLQASGAAAAAALTGTGTSDSGLAVHPAALGFNPGPAAGQLTLTLTNTGSTARQIGPPSASSASFTASTNCALLAPGAMCSIVVTFSPASSPASANLTVPVTVAGQSYPVTVPLYGAYTTQSSGLQILPTDPQFGPQSVATASIPRQFTITNLTAKYAAVSIVLPRQFVLTSAPCLNLAPNAACTFSLAFLPLTNGDITGTLFATAIPTDGAASLNGVGYVEGYGDASGALGITGPLRPGSVLDFGQLASGQSAQRTLILTNQSATASLTIRRIASQWPFLATSNCSGTLAPGGSCSVNVIYTPLNQIAAGTNPPPFIVDTALLLIESDAASSPDTINLTGTATPTVVSLPSNAAAQPVLSLSQGSLAFAAVASPQAITVLNNGNLPVHLFGMQAGPDFNVSTACSTLAPGATCSAVVSFTPQNFTGSSTRMGAIEISSDASAPLEFVSLSAAVSPPSLSVSPASLDFGNVALGASSTLPLQLTNTGVAPATLLSLFTTGDYLPAPGTCPAPPGSLLGNSTCTLQVTFTPTQSGTRPGTLTIGGSPTSVPITGIGFRATSFSLTVNGGAAASATVQTGASATYSLAVTPLGGFNGVVALACTPIVPAAYASCSIAPSSVALAASTQAAVAMITTIVRIGQAAPPPQGRRTSPGIIALCLMVCVLLPRRRLRVGSMILAALLASIGLVSTIGCGGNTITPIARAAPGVYQYEVTGTSTAGGALMTQTVTLNLIVQ